jgi:hypothetical protein
VRHVHSRDGVGATERLFAWSLRQLRVSCRERERLLAGLPDDVRERVTRYTRPGGGAPRT